MQSLQHPLTPTTPKVCNLSTFAPLPMKSPSIEKQTNNKNESVTVTHFSDIHGGVVEKISVPVTSSSSVENGTRAPKMENTTTTKSSTTISNNPFADDMMTTIITTSTTTSPTVKISTNPFLRRSFNANESVDSEKSLKISFPIVANNPFHMSLNDSQGSSSNGGNDVERMDEVDNENNLTSLSSINMKIDNNVTTIQMETHPMEMNGNSMLPPLMNGFKNYQKNQDVEVTKKVWQLNH